MPKSKLFAGFAEAVAGIPDGSTIAFGGFAGPGTPFNLIRALLDQGARNLTCVSNTTGGAHQPRMPDIGMLVENGQVRKVVCSFTAATRPTDVLPFARFHEAGEVEAELVPQGPLAERLRAAGSGIPAFYTPTGVGTMVAEGGIPVRYDAEGTVVKVSEPKEVRVFDGQQYVLETALTADFAIVRAAVGDRHGNLVFHESAGNFNAPAGMAGRITIAEVEELVEPGGIQPEHVHLPGVFVDRVVVVGTEGKRIENRTTRRRSETEAAPAAAGDEATADTNEGTRS